MVINTARTVKSTSKEIKKWDGYPLGALFFNILFKSYGQIFFCNSAILGFLFFLATFYNPVMAFTGLIGGCLANLAGLFFHSDRPYLKAGLFGCNGVLTGLAWGYYLGINPASIAVLCILSVFCGILAVIFIDIFTRKFDLPILSTVFVIITLIGIMAVYGFNPDTIEKVHNPYTIKPLVDIEKFLINLFPNELNTFFKVLGSTFFQGNVLTGLIFFLCILFYSRISALMACIGCFICALMSYGLFGNLSKILETSIGFNCVLISLALGGLFVVLNIRSLIYAVLAISVGFFIGSAASPFLKFFNLPVLAFPFNLTALLFLYPLRTGFLEPKKTGLYTVPLAHVSKPEESLVWYRKKKHAEESQKVKISLPFYGIWYISQGHNSVPTHQGPGTYAWDFIVVDGEKLPFLGNGVKNENYFCFGLPVLSPADGKIVKVINNVTDNEPGETNDEENWGNCVIIDHGNNEYSEISHFKENSIIVKEGDLVLRGQLLGYCGNSGLSPEPHIHYQLQRSINLGSETIPAVFTNIIRCQGGFEIIKSGVPKEGDFVRNYEEV